MDKILHYCYLYIAVYYFYCVHLEFPIVYMYISIHTRPINNDLRSLIFNQMAKLVISLFHFSNLEKYARVNYNQRRVIIGSRSYNEVQKKAGNVSLSVLLFLMFSNKFLNSFNRTFSRFIVKTRRSYRGFLAKTIREIFFKPRQHQLYSIF